MFRLYWKIFLGFWLTGVLLGIAAIVVNQQLSQNKNSELTGLGPAEIANRTAFILRRLPEDVRDWQQTLADSDITLFIRSNQAQSLGSTSVALNIEKAFTQLESQNRYNDTGLTQTLWGENVTSINGSDIKFVLDMPGLGVFQFREIAGQITAQFALAMIVSGIACWILARYLTRNLAKISEATQKLAAGKLDTRISVRERITQDELDGLSKDFNVMAEALETSMANQRRLVRDISHELRSPLARLQIALELARQNQDEEQLNRIGQEADRLNDMIGQLLAMPERAIDLQDCIDVGELVAAIAEDSEIEANTKNIRFTLDINGEFLVAANTNDLHSALENIVRNAIRYTEPEKTINISLKHLVDNENKSTYQLLVKDNGPGIPEEDLPYIFEPFYRVDPARNRKTGGYGIGLAIVKRVIAAHGGNVTAQNWRNSRGSGLIVTVTLPQFKPHSETSAA